MIQALRDRVYAAVVRHLGHATLLEGRLKGRGEPCRCLFVENSTFQSYVKPLLYEGTPRTVWHRRIPIQSLRGLLDRHPAEFDLCVAVIPLEREPAFRGRYAFRTSEWVRQTVRLTDMHPEARARAQKSARHVNHQLAKHGMSCRISRDPADFDFFYHRMFLPLIRGRYPDGGVLDTPEEMKPYFDRGFLVLAVREGAPIAGALVHPSGKVLIHRRTGLLDGDRTLVHMGAQGAVFHFTLEYAQANGFERVDFMKSRPFLSDGVYVHKQRWGAEVEYDDEEDSCVLLFEPAEGGRLAAFLETNPVVVVTDGGLKALTGRTGSDSLMRVESGERSRLFSPGLRGLLILSEADRSPIEIPFT